MSVTIKTPEEIEKMRVAGRLAAEVLDFVAPHVRPNVTTDELDALCHDYMVNVQKTMPAPLNYAPPGYQPYPKSICTSVNHVVCHGVPGPKKLKAGDVINIDVTVIKDGFHGDTSRMFFVGEPSIQARRLSDITYECMWRGIKAVKPGAYPRRHRLCDPVARRRARFFRGARVLRPRYRQEVPRRAAGPALRPCRNRA